jgi:isoleucyl-tRNA synthetase
MTDMDLVIKVCSLGRSARSSSGVKLRQPLSEVKVIAEAAVLERVKKFGDIILDELNVKSLSLSTRRDELIEFVVKPLPSVLGKKHGKMYPSVREAIEKTDQKKLVSTLEKGTSADLKVGKKNVKLLPEEVKIESRAREGYALSEEDKVVVGVKTLITGGLEDEGLARDIVRRIQNQRKEANFNIADIIETYYEAGPKLSKVFETFGDYIAAETLSATIRRAEPPAKVHIATYKIAGETLKIGLTQIKKGLKLNTV